MPRRACNERGMCETTFVVCRNYHLFRHVKTTNWNFVRWQFVQWHFVPSHFVRGIMSGGILSSCILSSCILSRGILSVAFVRWHFVLDSRSTSMLHSLSRVAAVVMSWTMPKLKYRRTRSYMIGVNKILTYRMTIMLISRQKDSVTSR